MKDVITTLIPRYGELNRIYKDWSDNKGFSFEKQKFITKFYLDYNDVTVLETAILELVFHLPQEQYTDSEQPEKGSMRKHKLLQERMYAG